MCNLSLDKVAVCTDFYSSVASIPVWLLFQCGFYSSVASIPVWLLFQCGFYSSAASIPVWLLHTTSRCPSFFTNKRIGKRQKWRRTFRPWGFISVSSCSCTNNCIKSTRVLTNKTNPLCYSSTFTLPWQRFPGQYWMELYKVNWRSVSFTRRKSTFRYRRTRTRNQRCVILNVKPDMVAMVTSVLQPYWNNYHTQATWCSVWKERK